MVWPPSCLGKKVCRDWVFLQSFQLLVDLFGQSLGKAKERLGESFQYFGRDHQKISFLISLTPSWYPEHLVEMGLLTSSFSLCPDRRLVVVGANPPLVVSGGAGVVRLVTHPLTLAVEAPH